MGRLDGKVAIITGAASGLGRAGALLFAHEGAKVVVVDVDAAGAEQTVAQVTQEGGDAVTSITDISKVDQVQAMIAATIERDGQIDILWNNAAVINALYSSLEEITEAEWGIVIAVNLTGTFHCCKAAIPHMKERKKGCIINTASIAGLVAHRPGRAAYVASKGGIIALTRQLSLELGPHNIRVNAIAPGSINTGMRNKVAVPDKVTFEYKRTDADVDALRPAEPIEIARTALFLASDDVGPLTGAILPHDGGKSAR